MTIIEVTPIEYRKFSGYDEPQFPTGMWVGTPQVTGDGSAGDMVAQLNFTEATSFRNSQYYSLEQLVVTFNAAISSNLRLAITNMDSDIPNVSWRYSIELLLDQSGSASMRLRDAMAVKGIFLGQQRTVDSAAGMSFSQDNDDGQVLSVIAQGYVWSARSTAVPGGPQRPPTGLYMA